MQRIADSTGHWTIVKITFHLVFDIPVPTRMLLETCDFTHSKRKDKEVFQVSGAILGCTMWKLEQKGKVAPTIEGAYTISLSAIVLYCVWL